MSLLRGTNCVQGTHFFKKIVNSQAFCVALNSMETGAVYICPEHEKHAGCPSQTGSKKTEYGMKNRNWFCYSLDMFGLAMLVGAGLALVCAFWVSGTSEEAVVIGAFRTALELAVGSFLLARSCEIGIILMHDRVAAEPAIESFPSDNVEQLPTRDTLPRAA